MICSLFLEATSLLQVLSVAFSNSSDKQSLKTQLKLHVVSPYTTAVPPTNKRKSQVNYGLNPTTVTLITDYYSSFLYFSNTKNTNYVSLLSSSSFSFKILTFISISLFYKVSLHCPLTQFSNKIYTFTFLH